MPNLIDSILDDHKSTTQILERAACQALLCRVAFRKKYIDDHQQECMLRASELYFSNGKGPVLYSISSLMLTELDEVEARHVESGVVPIGQIFNYDLSKSDLYIERLKDKRLQQILNTHSNLFYHKRYKLWNGKRYIGLFKEIFNKESLTRC